MKKFTFVLMLFVAGLLSHVQGQTRIIADYDGTDMGFGGWSGPVAFAKVSNPDATGINTSANVGEISHSGAQWEGIQTDAADILDPVIDFTQTPFFRIKVYCSNPIEITFKLQNSPEWWTSTERKYTLSAEETNKWVELTFSFLGTDLTNINQVVLHFDGNADYSTQGTKYYFDDIIASNVPPPGETYFDPANNDTDVKVYKQLKITSNLSMRLINDNPITDATSVLNLKKTDANGEDVPFTGTISDDKLSFNLIPDAMLDPNTVYWYGIKENTVEYEIGEEVVTNASASFSTSATGFPNINTIIDFDGISKCKVVETMGDPAPAYSVGTHDPVDGANNVLQFDKGTSWSGWERAHFELTYPLEIMDGKAAFSLRIYSPKTGGILLKISDIKDSDSPDAKKAEIWADVTEANTWQTLYYEFDGLDPVDYSHIFIFPIGGNADAATYYIDDLKGPDTPAPVVNVDYVPATNATGVNQFINLSLRSNYALANINGSEITDLTGKVALRKGGASGTDVPFVATISEDKKKITFDPDGLLDLGSVYWFGVIDNTLAFEVNGEAVTGMNSTFTVRETAIDMVVYDDFDGTQNRVLIEPLGDPAGALNTSVFDPVDVNNTVAQWSKGTSWGGWERIHVEFDKPLDLSGDKIFSVRIYAPKVNNVLFKVTDTTADPAPNQMEIWQEYKTAYEWQTFYYDFSDIDQNASYKHIYIFIDAGTQEANDYYVDDIKGPGFQTSSGLIDHSDRDVISVSPNPVSDILRIKGANNGEMVEIYGATGNMVKNVQAVNGSVSVADLPRGLYFVKVNGKTAKIIKK